MDTKVLNTTYFVDNYRKLKNVEEKLKRINGTGWVISQDCETCERKESHGGNFGWGKGQISKEKTVIECKQGDTREIEQRKE